MTDQYGSPVPDDLVLLDSDWLKWLTDEDIKAFEALRWYKYQPHAGPPASNLIWVSEKAVAGILKDGWQDFFKPEDFYFNDQGVDWLYIDAALHRWNAEGWYHA